MRRIAFITDPSIFNYVPDPVIGNMVTGQMHPRFKGAIRDLNMYGLVNFDVTVRWNKATNFHLDYQPISRTVYPVLAPLRTHELPSFGTKFDEKTIFYFDTTTTIAGANQAAIVAACYKDWDEYCPTEFQNPKWWAKFEELSTPIFIRFNISVPAGARTQVQEFRLDRHTVITGMSRSLSGDLDTQLDIRNRRDNKNTGLTSRPIPSLSMCEAMPNGELFRPNWAGGYYTAPDDWLKVTFQREIVAAPFSQTIILFGRVWGKNYKTLQGKRTSLQEVRGKQSALLQHPRTIV